MGDMLKLTPLASLAPAEYLTSMGFRVWWWWSSEALSRVTVVFLPLDLLLPAGPSFRGAVWCELSLTKLQVAWRLTGRHYNWPPHLPPPPQWCACAGDDKFVSGYTRMYSLTA